MRFDGAWRLCDDGVVRPVIPVPFLLDVGADRTVFSAAVLDRFGGHVTVATQELEGIGGKATSVILSTTVRLIRETGAVVSFEGQFAAFTEPAALDMSVLGRDITNLFAVIIDRPQDVVCMLGARHRYRIEEE